MLTMDLSTAFTFVSSFCTHKKKDQDVLICNNVYGIKGAELLPCLHINAVIHYLEKNLYTI